MFAPIGYRLHDGNGRRLPIKQWRPRSHDHGMHQIAVEFHDLRQGFEISGQDGVAANFQAAWSVINPGGL